MAQADDREYRLDRRSRRVRDSVRRYLIVWSTVAALALLAQAVAPAETPRTAQTTARTGSPR